MHFYNGVETSSSSGSKALNTNIVEGDASLKSLNIENRLEISTQIP